ncbi:MAG: hypothetical protein CMD50_00185 [Gammaproteobacteria bacterium]|nr:hypothetical protein [Gammaproteobacteria bacterium]|tara:strand:+ start:2311 stop:3159 length:849 start_codon:yes stop_codon:yes gene_type:complete
MINKKNLAGVFALLLLIASCSVEESSEQESSSMLNVRYNEFMACEFGPDMTSDNLTAMISEWQQLITSEELIGAWGYSPASDQNAWGDVGWWELEWTSKEAAESAWAEWESNKDAAAWTEKHAGVMQCDGPGRFKFDGIFPIPFETYGEKNPNGYFYSEFHGCTYNEGSSQKDAEAFVSGFNNAVAEADYSDTGYHYGNYFAHNNSATNPRGEGADFLWANFTKTKEMNDKANAAFEAEVREKMFPLFSEFASCGDNPDVYHGWTLYDADDKDFMPTFPTQE